MKIGTALTPSANKIMLLGCGELGKEVIIALQRFGVEVIGVDRYANAPGHQVAHRSHVIDMTDPEALKAVVAQEQPDIIVPEIEAIATEVLLELEQSETCEVIPTARAANLTMNREGIRTLAAETLKLPTSRYAFADTLEELRDAINNVTGYPCIIKPIMSSSGKGQSSIDGPQDVDKAWDYAMSGGRVKKNRIVVEEKIDFDYEITLLTVRAIGSSGEIETHFCKPIGHRQVGGDYVESWQPQEMTAIALERAQDIAHTITRNLGGRGIFGVELFIKDDRVWFSEVSPRPHDTGMVTMISQVQNEFELHARAILGLPVSTALRSEGPFAGASAVIYGGKDKQGLSFENVDKALLVPQTDIRLFGKPEAFTKRRMGVALAYADTVELAREHAKQSAGTVTTD